MFANPQDSYTSCFFNGADACYADALAAIPNTMALPPPDIARKSETAACIGNIRYIAAEYGALTSQIPRCQDQPLYGLTLREYCADILASDPLVQFECIGCIPSSGESRGHCCYFSGPIPLCD